MRASPIAASSLQFFKTTLCKVASIGQVKIGPIGQASVDNVDFRRQRRMSQIGNSLHRRKTRRLGQTVEPSCSERMSEIPVPARDSSLQARSIRGPCRSTSVSRKVLHAGATGSGEPKGNQIPQDIEASRGRFYRCAKMSLLVRDFAVDRCVDPSLGLTGCKQWVGVLGYTME